MNIIVAVLLIAVLGTCFIGTYVWNKRTPVPDGVDIDDAGCRGCTLKSCRKRE